MCDPVTASLVIAGVGTAATIKSGMDAVDAQKSATEQATKNAKTTADQADQAYNAANAKSPNVAGVQSATEQAAKGGQSGTLLTGAKGVDPSTLLLGKATLLGG